MLRRGGAMTAYAVRQVFLVSPSDEWSGSAGAVYPALARLKAARKLTAKARKDGRGSVAYAPSAAGLAAHDAWLCDVARATGSGTDPFRTRAAAWHLLAPERRRALLAALRKEVARQRDALRNRPPADEAGDAVLDDLNLAHAELRLAWLEQQT